MPTDQLFGWIAHQGELGGFSIEGSATAQPGYVYFKKPEKTEQSRLRSVRYDGVLVVTDPAGFHEALVQGIGSGKAFGFGLLSLAPLHPSNPLEAT